VHPWLPLSFLNSSHHCFYSVPLGGGRYAYVTSELTWTWEVKNVVALAPVREDAEGLICKVTLIEGEVVEALQAQEVVEENFRCLPDMSADGAWQLVLSEMGCRV
jgi:hypothetical protein